MLKSILISALIFIGAFAAQAQEVSGERPDTSCTMELKIAYPVNESVIYEDYMSNVRILAIVREHLQNSPQIDSITIFSCASPEGPSNLNKCLAEERGRRAKEYILRHLPPEKNIPADRIKIDPTHENWQGLYDMVCELYPYDDKDDVIALLLDESITNEQRKSQLKKINGGRPWRYIRDEILPHLRYATWIAVWQKVRTKDELPTVHVIRHPNLEQSHVGIIMSQPAQQPSYEARKTILALKSNMLYDVASLLNFSIEVPIYKDKFSALYYHQAPWWTWGEADNEYCIRFLSIGGEARWWFWRGPGRNPGDRLFRDRLTGHYLGLYAESGKYDFEHKTSFCRQGEFWSTGLSYGYAMPIGKRLNLEFSLSAGYASIAFRGYDPSDDYEILWADQSEVGRVHYWGITKAQVTLAIPITVRYKAGGRK